MVQSEWQRDGWDAVIRVGLLTPAADVGPEAEMNAMVPPTVTVHAARVPFAAMRPGGEMDPTIARQAVVAFAEPPGVDAATELLAACPVQVIGFGFTSSAYASGRDGETRMCSRLSDRARGVPVVAACAAMANAARAVGGERLSLVNPPWFDGQLTALGAEYFASSGFDVVAAASCSLPSDQKAITPELLHAWVVEHTPDSADVIVIGGNGFRAVGVIETLERDLGRPVVTANQALLWACLAAAGASAPIDHYGSLLRGVHE
jgi:maleate isomerase